MEEYLVPTGFGEDEFVEKKSRFLGRVWPVDTEAEALAQRLRQTNPPKEILIAPFDPANGCHAGPGALALFFEGDETVRLHP